MLPVADDPTLMRAGVGREPDDPKPSPGSLDVLGAAFLQQNTLVSAVRSLSVGSFPIEEDHNPLDVIRGTKYFELYPYNFIESRSEAETRSIMSRIDEEEREREILDSAGVFGIVAQIGAGIVDPTIALPGGALVRGVKGGYSILRSGAVGGAAGAATAAAAESVLQATQETRTAEESAIAIGTATILSAFLGAGAAKLLTPVERSTSIAAIDAARASLDARAPLPAAVGAAAADARVLNPVGYGLDRVPGVGRAASKLFPTLNALENGDVTTRRIVADLAEIPFRVEENLEGLPTTRAGGPAAEREISMLREGLNVRLGDELLRLWTDHRFGQVDVKAPRIRDTLSRWQGTRPAGKMSFDEFDAEVYDALSKGDQHEIPQVAEAAQWIRRNVIEPIAQRAETSLPGFERTALREGESYAPRSWNRELIRARWGEYVETWTDHLAAQQTVKAAAKQRIEFAVAQRKSWDDQVKKFEARLSRLDAKRGDLAARLDERAMEVRRQENRGDILAERSASIADDISEIEEFIGAMRQELRDPAMLERLAQMERDLAALRRPSRPVSEAQLRRIEDEELQSILTGETRMAAEMLVGRRRMPSSGLFRGQGFLSWLVSQGGVRDMGGDLAFLSESGRSRPGLLNNAKGRSLDEVAERIAEEAPGLFPARDVPGRGLPSHREILGWIDDALRGQEPDWWVQSRPVEARQAGDAAALATAMDEVLSRAGVEVRTIRDVAKLLRDDSNAGVTLADLDRIAADMEAAGESVPASMRAAAVGEEIAGTRKGLADLRAVLQRAMAARDARGRRLAEAEARGGEAALAERANRGRFGVLDERMDRADRRRELIVDAIELARQSRDEVRAKIEAEVAAWEGKSAKEAKSAIRSREQYATQTGRAADAPRLEGADDAIDRVAERIIASERDLSVDELRARAEEIASRVLGTPEGRLPYDLSMGGPQTGVPRAGASLRGNAARREIDVPYEMAAPWLDRSATRAVQSYLHSVLPDTILAERFGDADMLAQFKEIETAYSARLRGAQSEAESKALRDQMDRDMTLVAGMRDRLRGVYGYDPQMRNLARVSQAALKVNNIVSSHAMAIASIPDMAGTVFRHGLQSAFADGWRPFLSALMDAKQWDAWKRSGSEWRAFGLAIETRTAARQHALDGIAENYRPASRFERALSWASDKAFLVNLLAPLTDLQKRIATNVASHNILRASKAVVEGRATQAQIATLGEANITPQLAERIWRSFNADGGADVGGVLLPNLADWTDTEARQAFAGAVARDVSIAVMTPGQEKPLFMSRNGWNVLTQYKTFAATATLRILIANLQRSDAATLSGLVVAVGMGMLAYRLQSLLSGRPTSDRPADWLKEGISRSGILGWLDEGNSIMAKATRGGVDAYRLVGADKPLSKFVNRSATDMLLGPTFGKLQNLQKVTGAAGALEWTEADTHALRMMTLGSNLPYLPRLFDQAERGFNGAFGIPMRAQ